MKCFQVERLMEDYNDRELSREQVPEVEAHLSGCMHCSRLLDSLRREDKTYESFGKDLEQSLEIPPTMWAKICRGLDAESSIESEPVRRDRAGWLSGFWNMRLHFTAFRQVVFASILLAILAGGILLVIHRHGGSSAITADREQRRDLQYALLSIQKAEKQYVQAIQVLSSIVDQRKASLDPGVVAELDRNLKIVDEAIASAQRAYRAHPADSDLALYMLRAYQKKVELLQDLALRTS